MPTIRQLPIGLVNKIAAGEVIERPASVVKEMLENSIDAGATHVEISVEGGGIELIRISDNGCGIPSDQLDLAVAPHATSKLQSSDDLFDVKTLGFRGEALASIAEISHLTLRSRIRECDSGFELCVKGGEKEPIRPCSAPVGTTIEIRHLFFNTPVRRKFMKTSQTEMGHVTEAFTRIALAYPNVHMVLTNNERVLHDLLPTERWSERIRAFFGDEVADSLIFIDQRDERVGIHGYVTDPSVSRSNNRMQYLFLNGRYIRDKSLQHALGEAYRGLLMVGRMPVCFLHVQVDPKTVDVNVHPTKVEVRFEDSGAIYTRLLHSLRHKFLNSDLVAKVRTPTASPSLAPTLADDLAPIATSHHVSNEGRDSNLLHWAKSNAAVAVPDFRPFDGSGAMGYGSASLPAAVRPVARMDDPFYSPEPSHLGMPASALQRHTQPASGLQSATLEPWLADEDANASTAITPVQHLVSAGPIAGSHKQLGFQIHNRYLVTEDEAGMVLIDQHALHERILYEQVKTKVMSKSLERQRLLVPETVTLSANEAAAAIESRETLAEIGIEVEPFGGDTVLVTSYPAMLAKMQPAEMLRQVLEPLMAGGKKPDARDLLDELMNMIACKAAVKAGDRLSPDEITALLEQRHCYQDTHHCPHGRPTALFFSREQLDKMFKRT
ncbi:MAG: DNA mismatch repair endonuclease MutL [Planctomycetota bacterium]|nr:DNA mismatch repair endonuclease MutL [Planctomycetota bacterium]